MTKKDLILESTTLWDFPTQNYGNRPHGNNKYRGVTPAFVIWNLLERYTKVGDLVVDPMCGSGTTFDVATELKRKPVCFDLNIVREEVIKADARKLPVKDNIADFVFIDSPYSDNLKYSDHPDCIGKISCEDDRFFDQLEFVAVELKRIMKEGKVIAWLIGDQWKKKKFIPTGFYLYQRLARHFTAVDLIAVTRHNQTSNTGVWHHRARQYNFYLRGFKHLLIMRNTKFD